MGICHYICLRYCLVCIGVCMCGYMGSEVNPQVVFQVSLFFFLIRQELSFSMELASLV